MEPVVLSLSGGMDSASLMLHFLRKHCTVVALSFDYGQKHKIELTRAKELVEYLNDNINNDQVPLPIVHQVIKLEGLSKLLVSSLVEGGKEVPEGHYQQENMKDTVVPNRNKIFSSILQAVALSIANNTGQGCSIALGIHAGDHDIYPDCRQEFRDADYTAFLLGNWNSHQVNMVAPYLSIDKYEILKDGVNSCAVLGIDFNEVYKRTNTSYKPIFIPADSKSDSFTAISTGAWYADYKSASSVERVEAFIKLGVPDPVAYADEQGPVEWEKVVSEVSKVLASRC